MSRKPNQKELLQRINELEEQVDYLENQVGIYQAQNRARQAVVENFQRLADRAREAIYHYEIETRQFTFYNTRFHQLFHGGGPIALTPKNVLMHIHPEDRPKVKAAKAASLTADPAIGEAEYRFMLPTREIRWMQDRWIVIHDQENRATAIEGFIRDITANKQVAEELKLARRNALIGIYIVRQGRFRYVNPAFTRITGFSQEELVGKPSLNLVVAEDRPQVREAAIEMLKNERFEPYEFRIRNKAGQIRWIMETVASIRHDDRRAVLGDFMDISAKMNAAQHRKEEERLRGVIEMAGAICHELTNPMQVILTAANKLHRQPGSENSEERELSRLIAGSIRKMSRTTASLNQITRYAVKHYVNGKQIIDLSAATQADNKPTQGG